MEQQRIKPEPMQDAGVPGHGFIHCATTPAPVGSTLDHDELTLSPDSSRVECSRDEAYHGRQTEGKRQAKVSGYVYGMPVQGHIAAKCRS